LSLLSVLLSIAVVYLLVGMIEGYGVHRNWLFILAAVCLIVALTAEASFLSFLKEVGGVVGDLDTRSAVNIFFQLIGLGVVILFAAGLVISSVRQPKPDAKLLAPQQSQQVLVRTIGWVMFMAALVLALGTIFYCRVVLIAKDGIKRYCERRERLVPAFVEDEPPLVQVLTPEELARYAGAEPPAKEMRVTDEPDPKAP
jgi:hypothetical protein